MRGETFAFKGRGVGGMGWELSRASSGTMRPGLRGLGLDLPSWKPSLAACRGWMGGCFDETCVDWELRSL